MKLPKQIKRWIYKARLRPDSGSRWARQNIMCFKGHGRRWRIVGTYLDMSCPIAEFDRWANSLEQRMVLPTCEEDFVNTVKWIGGSNVH
jgi:hypothetical protein